MVPLSYIHNNSQQLGLVQETPLELRFQYNQHRSSATTHKRKGWFRAVAIAAPFTIFAWHLIKSGTLNTSGTFLYSALIPLATVSLLLFLSITYLSPYSKAWVFNSSTGHLIRIVHRFFWGQSQRAFPFNTLQDVVVQQKEDSDNEYRICTYIYIALRSGKEIKLSQSGFFTDAREKALALKHHQDIARKMRERVGLRSSASAKDHDVYIPSEQEVAQQRENTLNSAKELFGNVFNSKSEKALKIVELQLKTTQSPHDAQSWEQLALLLVQNKASIQDGLKAYHQAEMLYREQGNLDKSRLIHAALKRFQAS